MGMQLECNPSWYLLFGKRADIRAFAGFVPRVLGNEQGLRRGRHTTHEQVVAVFNRA